MNLSASIRSISAKYALNRPINLLTTASTSIIPMPLLLIDGMYNDMFSNSNFIFTICISSDCRLT